MQREYEAPNPREDHQSHSFTRGFSAHDAAAIASSDTYIAFPLPIAKPAADRAGPSIVFVLGHVHVPGEHDAALQSGERDVDGDFAGSAVWSGAGIGEFPPSSFRLRVSAGTAGLALVKRPAGELSAENELKDVCKRSCGTSSVLLLSPMGSRFPSPLCLPAFGDGRGMS